MQCKAYFNNLAYESKPAGASAKGLQFPVVFIPDVCDVAFPNLCSWNRISNVTEECRLLFVTLTRDEEGHLSWADEWHRGYSVSRTALFWITESSPLARRNYNFVLKYSGCVP